MNAGGNASVADFIAYAEKVSGRDLGALFDTWLFTPSKPASPAAARAGISASAAKERVQPKSWKKIAETNTIHDHGDRHGGGH
ncbi:hypothetical protein BIV24_03135 [Streptomyces colonosanans]|uniref:Peptidase M1 membrane alanine aminopeptidase domain-containing protein n=1 Tax=Streptomyces colonosanans TaxID=1428652 RepID=A0A1S2Q1P3_9ACTN|nr:hypothetical protein BIV24_03135 [Streptomyces colonosanans]